LIKVANSDHIESSGLKSLRNQTGIVGWCRKRSGRVIRVANDQGDALFCGLGTGQSQFP
jgi:hypothetical protein